MSFVFSGIYPYLSSATFFLKSLFPQSHPCIQYILRVSKFTIPLSSLVFKYNYRNGICEAVIFSKTYNTINKRDLRVSFFLHFPDRRLKCHTKYCVWYERDHMELGSINLWGYGTDSKFQAFKITVFAEAFTQETVPQSSGSFQIGNFFFYQWNK